MNETKFNKNNAGRPPHFETPEELENKCSEYFSECVKSGEKPTITGLTLHVGFSSRASWDDYKKRDKSEEGKLFSYIVKRAKLTVENSYETSGTTFDVFALKQMGWSDKTEVSNTNLNLNKEITKEDLQKAKETLKEKEDEF